MGDLVQFAAHVPDYPLTDSGNAELFRRLWHRAVRYLLDKRCWIVWSGKRWEYDVGNATVRRRALVSIREFVRDSKWAAKSESSARIDAMLSMAQSLEGMSLVASELDANDGILNVNNGVIDLDTQELLPHDPNYLCSHITDTDFIDSARSELWEKFLHRATGGDENFSSYLARFAGYCLGGSIGEKCFFFVYGPGDTSKSTFLNAIGRMMGDYCAFVNIDTWMKQQSIGGNRGDLVRLMGCRVAISGEPNAGSRFDSSLIKQFTGGDPITFAAKYQGECTFKPKAKIVMAGNDSPAIRGGDEPLWRRMRRIPFDVQIPRDEQDRKLADKLAEPDVRSAILAWAINGLREWKRSGLGMCEAVAGSTAEYRESEDEFMQFIGDNYVITGNENDTVGSTELSVAYEEWSRREMAAKMSGKSIVSRLVQLGCKKHRTRSKRLILGIRHHRGVGDTLE